LCCTALSRDWHEADKRRRRWRRPLLGQSGHAGGATGPRRLAFGQGRDVAKGRSHRSWRRLGRGSRGNSSVAFSATARKFTNI
jgi:hypothetical protein